MLISAALEVSKLIYKAKSCQFPASYFSLGHSSLFSQLHLVSKPCGAAGLKNQKIFTVEDGSGFSHQLPWLKQVPAALGEKLLTIKLLPVRRASWKLSVFNILMKSAIKILTTRLVAFQWHVLHLSLLLMVCKSDQRPQNAAETHISGILTPQNEEGKGGGRGETKLKVCAVEWIHLDSFWEVTFHLEESVRKESYSGINCYGIITQLQLCQPIFWQAKSSCWYVGVGNMKSAF